MKILFVNFDFFPLTNQIVEVVGNLIELGNEVIIMLPSKTAIPPKCKDKNFRFLRIPLAGDNKLGYFILSILSSILLVLMSFKKKPDVIYSRDTFLTLPLAISARLLNVPFFYNIHPSVLERQLYWGPSIKSKLIKLTEKIVFALSRGIITPAHSLKSLLSSTYNVPKSKIFVVTNGANEKLFAPMDSNLVRKALGLKQNHSYVGYFGSLFPYEGLDYIIKAARIVSGRKKKVIFIIGGIGPNSETVENLITETGMSDTVSFLKTIPYTNVPEYMNACDLLILYISPEHSRLSGESPLKLYSYMSCGRAVVSSDVDGLSGIIKKFQTGICVEPMNEEKLAEGIITLLEDKELCGKMGLAGREAVLKNFTWRKIAKNTMDIFRKQIG